MNISQDTLQVFRCIIEKAGVTGIIPWCRLSLFFTIPLISIKLGKNFIPALFSSDGTSRSTAEVPSAIIKLSHRLLISIIVHNLSPLWTLEMVGVVGFSAHKARLRLTVKTAGWWHCCTTFESVRGSFLAASCANRANKKSAPAIMAKADFWSEWWDSNPRPLGPEPSTHTKLSYTPKYGNTSKYRYCLNTIPLAKGFVKQKTSQKQLSSFAISAAVTILCRKDSMNFRMFN